MKLKFDYLEHQLNLNNEYINVIEIENKKYLYRIINDIKMMVDGEELEEIMLYDNDFNEISLTNKCKLLIDYFNIDLNIKKNLTSLFKIVKENITDDDRKILAKEYKNITKIFTNILQKVDVSTKIDEDFEMEDLFKFLKLSIFQASDLLENLLLYIDVCKELLPAKILFFINLKDYLKEEELIELYKYAIYNSINIVLIDSHCYDSMLKYEKKLIIDENLDEFVI